MRIQANMARPMNLAEHDKKVPMRPWVACYQKNVKVNRVGSRYEIKCPLGLWSVEGPNVIIAETEARNYFQQYYEDGEYDQLD